MKNKTIKIFAIVILSIGFAFTATAQNTSLAIIGHNRGVPSAMRMTELKSILKGEKQRWADGTKVTIALMATKTPLGSNISKKVYNMNGNALDKYFAFLQYQGKIDYPNFFATENELASFVMQTPGAIGVISETNTGRIITIDGKRFL